MSKANQVRAIQVEVAQLEARMRELNQKVAGIGYFLRCDSTSGGMGGCCCNREVFVAKGQNPPASWLECYDLDTGWDYVCSDCARKHADALREAGFERMGKTRSKRRRESLRRKRGATGLGLPPGQ